MAQYFNITGELTQELLAVGGNVSVSKISLTNIEGTNKCTVDLYIEKKFKSTYGEEGVISTLNYAGKFYLLKGVELPVGATLEYENPEFNNSTGEFGLFLKLNKSASETPSVDVILQ